MPDRGNESSRRPSGRRWAFRALCAGSAVALPPSVLRIVAVLVAVPVIAAQEGTPDPSAGILTAARLAAGGDGVLAPVTALDVKGTRVRTLGGGNFDESVEIALVLPDRYVERTERSFNAGPIGTSSSTRRVGFNGDDPIVDEITDGPLPPPIAATPEPTTAADIAAKRVTQVLNAKHTFTAFTLPLFAASFATYPLTMSYKGRRQGPTGPADALEATGSDRFTWDLFFDVATHRLVGISWKGKPVVVVTAHSTMAVSGGRVVGASPPPVLPSNPTANLPDATWQTTVADYRSADGVTWPHRFTTTVDGGKWEDLKVGAYKINPKIAPGLFKASNPTGQLR